MIVYLAALAAFIMMLLAAPLTLTASYSSAGAGGLRLRLSYYCFHLSYTVRLEGGLTLKRGSRPAHAVALKRPKNAGGGPDRQPGLRAIGRLARQIKSEHLALDAVISTDDAARDALLSGAASALASFLASARPGLHLRARIRPDFSGGGGLLRLRGIFSITAGQIIMTAVYFIAQIIIGRIKKNGQAPD